MDHRTSPGHRAGIRHRETSKHAPSYNLPHHALISIEHPCIIKNVGKAIQTLGGLSKMKALVQENNQRAPARLYLHPDDRMSNPISSNNVKTNNVVLQIVVPKRTGLKRRRGALGPYHEGVDELGSAPLGSTLLQSQATSKKIPYLLRSLRDNTERYKIQPFGSIHITHRFRDMPDFVYTTVNSPFVQKMRDCILPFEYEKLKNFQFDMSKGPRYNIDLVPPPRWSHVKIPFNYSYLQNSSSKQMMGVFDATTENNQRFLPARNQSIPYDEPNIPSGPAGDLPPLASLEPAMQRLIESARLLLDEQPIWTRRALLNRVSSENLDLVGLNSAKYIYQYVGYFFDSGPWRDAIVKFGVDPRQDPSLRIYQTMMFLLDKECHDQNRRKERKSRFGPSKLARKDTHIFDGEKISLDGKVWQVCDIKDPLLKSILTTTDIREDCHLQGDGWYHSGTWAKAKIIMKFKISTLIAGGIPNDDDYMRVVKEIPEIIDSHNVHLAHFPRGTATPLEVKLASQVRTAAKIYQWGISPARPETGDQWSSYGYRKRQHEIGEPGGKSEVEGDDDGEDESEERLRQEEERQAVMDEEEDELGPEDADSLDEDNISSDAS